MRVMVFGDSNSWGFPPDGSGLRMAPHSRWPGVMAAALGAELVEEALPGRTTAHDDPEMLGPVMNGLRHLPVALKSHCPLDLVVIMLGTNDLKARFSPSPGKIADNLGRLADCVAETGAGAGHWQDAATVPLALVVPPPLGLRADDADWERFDEWRGARSVSRSLAAAVTEMAHSRGIPVMDAGRAVQPSEQDPIHLSEAGHRTLGRAVADWLGRSGRPGGHD